MTLHRAQAIFDNRSTGIPRDRVVNTFHFWCTKADPDEADGDELRTMLHDFYAAMPGVIVGLADEWRLKLVSIADPAPRLPWYDSPDSIEWAVGEALPAENALVLSFQQELVSGVPIARQRGRIFIGGLKTTVNSAGRYTTTVWSRWRRQHRDSWRLPMARACGSGTSTRRPPDNMAR